jgi:hypothetical protein
VLVGLRLVVEKRASFYKYVVLVNGQSSKTPSSGLLEGAGVGLLKRSTATRIGP